MVMRQGGHCLGFPRTTRPKQQIWGGAGMPVNICWVRESERVSEWEEGRANVWILSWAVPACILRAMSVSRAHLLKQTAMAPHMWPIHLCGTWSSACFDIPCLSTSNIYISRDHLQSRGHRHLFYLVLPKLSIFTSFPRWLASCDAYSGKGGVRSV